MKRYNITVNGTTYDVAVTEAQVQEEAQAGQTAPVVAAPKPAIAPKAVSTGVQGGVKISAPMPGNIIEVKAKSGDNVKNGTVIAVLEAMKMENDIVAPKDGVIVSVNVAKGEAVNTGTVIATMD